MDHDPGDGISFRRFAQAANLYITETVEGEVRLKNLLALTGESEKVRRLTTSQARGINRAVRIEHFAVADGDPLSRRAADFQAHPTHHVLAQIKRPTPRPRFIDLDGFQLLNPPRRLHQRSLYLRIRRAPCGHRPPCTIIKARRIPPGHRQPCVQLATHQQIRVADGTEGCLPALVTSHHLGAAIRQFNDKLRHESRPTAVEIALAEMRQRARIPAVTQNRAEGITALPNLRGDVIRLVVNALAELGPTGCKHVVADPLAIEVQLINTQRSDINHGPLDGLTDAEVLPEIRRWHPRQIRNRRRPAPGRAINDLGGSPGGIIKSGLFPAVRRLLRPLPTGINWHNQVLARIELHHQLADHCRMIGIRVTGHQSHHIHPSTQRLGHLQAGRPIPMHGLANRHPIHCGFAEIIGIESQHGSTHLAALRQLDLAAQVGLVAGPPTFQLHPLQPLDVHRLLVCGCLRGGLICRIIANPLGQPGLGIQQAHRPTSRFAPRRQSRSPHPHLPITLHLGLKGFPRVFHLDALAALHLAAVPQVALIFGQQPRGRGHQNLIGRLRYAARTSGFRLANDPRQTRLGRINPKRILPILAAQVRDVRGAQGGQRSQQHCGEDNGERSDHGIFLN